jgi:hypothetical protein
MDLNKCNALKTEVADEPEPQVVSIDRFFDGNDDLGSIGCNLVDHPGVDRFRQVLAGLLDRQDVEAVYALISELDPGEDSWPFTDTVAVVGSIPADKLRQIVAPLEPDEVGAVDDFGVPASLKQKHDAPVLVAWWD